MLVRRLTRSIVARGLVLLVLSAGVALAQGGYSKQDFLRYGLEDLPVPKRWDAIPVQPTEKLVVLSWAEKLPGEKDRRERRKLRPTLDLISLTVVSDPQSAEGTPTSSEENVSRGLPITSVDRYLNRNSTRGTWKKDGSTEVHESKQGRQRFERRFQYERKQDGGRPVFGWVFEWRTPEKVLFLFGKCAPGDIDQMVKIWRYMATRVKLVEAREPDLSKWERFYSKNSKFKDPAFRLNVRAKLAEVKGWKADDTPNYLIVYSTKDKALIRVLKRELEAIRRAYEGIFPPDQPLTQVSVLRVCKDAAEYHAYGGPSGSGGYWSSTAEELVFFDYQDKGQKRGSGKADSRVVLYHEAFHQYVFYAAGDLAPHSWFNEGTGDFFSGARFDSSGTVSAIGPNPWRVGTIKRAMETGIHTPLPQLFHASQGEYYSNPAVNYSEGWALVYFLRTSRQASKRPEWAKIHPTYYATLKTEWAEKRRELEQEGEPRGSKAYRAAQVEARETALEAALENVNLFELEKALIAFVEDLDG